MKWQELFLVVLFVPVWLVAHAESAEYEMEVVFRGLDPAPGGGDFRFFHGTTHVNSSGTVAFWAQMQQFEEGQWAYYEGIWRDTDVVIREGDIGPRGYLIEGEYGAPIEYSPTINNLGSVASLVHDTAAYEDGFIFIDPGNIIVDYQDRDMGGGESISWVWGPRINDSNSVVYFASSSLGYDYVLRDQAIVAKSGELAPNGDTYTGFWRPVQNNAGQVAYSAYLNDNYLESICTPTEVLAREGDVSPIGGNWNSLWGPSINNLGEVAWWGKVDTDAGTIEGFFTSSGPVVLAGDTAPNGMQYTAFEHAPSFNAFGTWIFRAEVYDSDTGQTLAGIFTLDSVVALEGGLDPDGEPYYRDSFSHPDISDGGYFAFFAESGGAEDIIVRGLIPIPEPSALTLAVLGMLGLVVCSRRRKQ